MNRLILILTFIPLLSFGQQFKKIITPSDTYFILNSIDTLTIPKGLPDGKWKVHFDNDTTKPQYIFHLKDNHINGFFMSYYSNGSWAAIGSYKDDSLWTFRTDKFGGNDTTFKTGLWHYQVAGFIKEHFHKIPFSENDSIYTDNWFYNNGRILSSRTYHKKVGLVKEIWFYENGERSSMLEKNNNYSTKTDWTKDQKISNFYLEQNFSYQLYLDTSDIKFDRCDDCIVQTVFDKQGKLISSISIDSNGKVRDFSSGGAYLRYDIDGNVKQIKYWNKKKKWKLKNLK
jgi:antitoxin component YwqK of YwqJK toxin-antitoxin module